MKLDILKSVFTPPQRRRQRVWVSLEEMASGIAAPEIEHVVYGRITDLSQLSRATHMEKQEQWEVKVPKTDDNGSRGTIRVRRTIIEGSPDEFTACAKVPAGDQSNPIERKEVVIPATEDFFNVIRQLSGGGMIKHRYFFPISAGNEVLSSTTANQPELVIEDETQPVADAGIAEAPAPETNDPVSDTGTETPAEAGVDATEEKEPGAVSTEGDTVDMLEAGTGIPMTGEELNDHGAEGPFVFTKQSVEIEAIRWTGKNAAQVAAFMNGNAASTGVGMEIGEDDGDSETAGELLIDTLEDGSGQQVQHIASIGDWIIRGVKGEYYPCKPDIFADTYFIKPKLSMEDDAAADPAGIDTSVAPVEGGVTETSTVTGAPEAVPALPGAVATDNAVDANPLFSPQSEVTGPVWELDLFIKPDGTYYDWVKLDLEVAAGDENKPLPPLPVDLTDIISAPYGRRTPEEETIVTNLYNTIFVARNPMAVPIEARPTPGFEQTKLVEDGTPADGTPVTSDGVGTPPAEPLVAETPPEVPVEAEPAAEPVAETTETPPEVPAETTEETPPVEEAPVEETPAEAVPEVAPEPDAEAKAANAEEGKPEDTEVPAV